MVRYNYATELFSDEPHRPAPPDPPSEALRRALRDKHPDLNSIIEGHKRKLLRLLEKAKDLSGIQKKPAIQTQVPPPRIPAALETGLAKAASAPAQAIPSKTGRNDPCPCGSGKKHKKCYGKS